MPGNYDEEKIKNALAPLEDKFSTPGYFETLPAKFKQAAENAQIFLPEHWNKEKATRILNDLEVTGLTKMLNDEQMLNDGYDDMPLALSDKESLLSEIFHTSDDDAPDDVRTFVEFYKLLTETRAYKEAVEDQKEAVEDQKEAVEDQNKAVEAAKKKPSITKGKPQALSAGVDRKVEQRLEEQRRLAVMAFVKSVCNNLQVENVKLRAANALLRKENSQAILTLGLARDARGGKKSRKQRKRTTIKGGKKSRKKTTKRATIKGGKRKRRRTRRRR